MFKKINLYFLPLEMSLEMSQEQRMGLKSSKLIQKISKTNDFLIISISVDNIKRINPFQILLPKLTN